MKILVTGGMGFLGSHLIDGLVACGYDVFSFDNLEPQVHPAGIGQSTLIKKRIT